jgi:predicted small metal-binding protein
MTIRFKCADAGVNCAWTTTAADEEELMKNIQEHAKHDHGMQEIPPDLLNKVKSAIKRT